MDEKDSRLRGVESLKKEAKRWLDALRGNDQEARERLQRATPGALAEPGLRQVQHALAVEHGFSGWTALITHVAESELSREAATARYEMMAQALLEAYRTGTPEAMQRHWSYTWHRRSWQGMRTYVQVDLGKQASPDIEITLEDARYLIAREHGFENWRALVKDTAAATLQHELLVKPVAPLAGGAGSFEAGDWHSRDWRVVTERLALEEATGLDANGQMTDAMLRDIEQLSHLTTLRLGGSQAVTDDGVRRLAGLPNLRHLDLSGTSVTDAGLAVLAQLPNLTRVSLSWTRVSDVGASALASCHALERVDLGGTWCGDGAIRSLAGKPTLRHVTSGSAVTDAGVALLHEYPAFKRWQEGDVPFMEITQEREPNRLTLRGKFTDRGVAQLKGLDGLFALDLDASELNISGHALAPLVDLPNLGSLSFDAKDDAMPHIARMPRLRFLGCQDTAASDDGWVALGASQSIERIWGRRCYGLANRGFLALGRIPTLRYLSVSCRNVDDDAIATLPTFPSLRELMPMDVPDAGYRHIGRCTSLEALTLMYCRDTTDAATVHITALPRLSQYFASYTQITDRTPELLSGIASLERVTFDSCAGLTNDGIAHLARLPRLKELRVSGRGLTRDVIRPFPPSVMVRYGL